MKSQLVQAPFTYPLQKTRLTYAVTVPHPATRSVFLRTPFLEVPVLLQCIFIFPPERNIHCTADTASIEVLGTHQLNSTHGMSVRKGIPLA